MDGREARGNVEREKGSRERIEIERNEKVTKKGVEMTI